MRQPARTARLAVVAAVAGSTVLAPLLVPVPPAGAAGAGPVEEARQAARRVPFSARVEVSWVDGSGLHTAELGVRSVGGQIRVQGPAGPARGDGSATVLASSGLSSPTPGGEDRAGGAEAGGLLAPALERKYDLERRPGPTVAGRETDEVVLLRGGEMRERLAIDKATRLVLQREVFGPDGRAVRVVRVLQLDTAPVPNTPAGTQRTDPPRRLRVSSLSSAYPVPVALSGGYHRLAAYRHARTVHLLYTDGLHGLSLFSQPGELRIRALPSGGALVRVGGSRGLRYTWPGGEVVTWQAGPMVHTLVGDATAEDLLAAARSVPRPKRPSVLARVRGTARLVTELVSGGR